MAHSRTAKKRVRQNIKAKALNRWRLRDMREAFKDFNEQLIHGTAQTAAESFKKASRVIDRTAQKGVIHKNQAARRKSRMSARLKAMKATAKA
jgi:small subunit ribosomal protein S20